MRVEIDLSAEALQRLRTPATEHRPPHTLGAGFTLLEDRLQFLLWRNNYDARTGTPIWWWTRKAAALGAAPGTTADVTLPDGAAAWIDGGPRGAHECATVHAETIQLRHLTPQPPSGLSAAGGPALAADQSAAAQHPAGALRVIAPAGSGKTRTLIARLLHLLDDRRVEDPIITAVAYNKRAAAEMRQRLNRPNLQVRTIHSLGWAIIQQARPGTTLLTDRERHARLKPLVPPTATSTNPYLEALSRVHVGLRDPDAVESARTDVPRFAKVLQQYEASLRERGECDHDDQVYEAIRLLLADPALRERWQKRCQHLLVDEFQDIAPSHLLLLRLLASPALNVFAVGDDDQSIYGYAHADPDFLVSYANYFPAATSTPLETCYRCPPAVVAATNKMLTRNTRRVAKSVHSADGTGHRDALLIVKTHESEMATTLARLVKQWNNEGTRPADVAVLSRVNCMLLPAMAALTDANIPSNSPLSPSFAARPLVRSTLAWVRLALDPDAMRPADLLDAIARPPRKLNRIAARTITGSRPLTRTALRRHGNGLGGQWGTAWTRFGADIDTAARRARAGNTAHLLDFLTTELGLLKAATLLDAGAATGNRGTHAHDLAALRRTASTYPSPGTFEDRLRDLLAAPETDTDDEVTLATIHRVKGMEWKRIVVFGADVGAFPHHLSRDTDEERRVLHVALTRACEQAVVIADAARPSPFLAELENRPARRRVTNMFTRSPRAGSAG